MTSEIQTTRRDLSGGMALALYLCFFISGVAGLIYEVLWAKYLALYVGSTGLAQVIVLATFMGGLALGSQLLGGLADRVSNPLKFFAFLQFGIGVYALLFDHIFIVGRDVFIAVARTSGLSGGGLISGKILACVLTILLPTFLMGGTLPAIARHMTRTLNVVGPRISRLYFLNSLGAVFGCLLAGFFLISTYGLQFSMIMGAMMNIAVGLVAMIVLTRERRVGGGRLLEEEPFTPSDERLPRWAVAVILISVSVSGGVSMMYEVGWIRLLTLVLGSSTYSFSLMLATFILGLSIGSFLLSLRKKTSGYSLIFGLSETAVGLTVLLMLPLYVKLPYWFNQLSSSLNREPETFGLYQFSTFMMCAAVMIIPTILQGITLPAAIKLLVPDVRRLGHRIGYTYAVNTVGTLVGSVAAGFLGLPLLGIKGTLELAVGLNCALGLAIVCTERRTGLRMRALALALLAVLGVWAWYAFSMVAWDKQVLSAGIYRTRERIPSYEALRREADKRTTLFYRDGIDATIAIQSITEPRPELMLVINGKVDASTGADMPTQKIMAHLPLMLHPNPRKVLIVGIGSGATIGSVIAYDSVEKVDVVELSRDVIDASRYFESVNGAYWDDPRVNVYWEDAKTFLQITDEQYDVIISEPTNPWIAGVAGVFSREYFLTCNEHLSPGGFFVQWIQSYELQDSTFFLILETFSGVFPCYTLWNPSQSDTVLVGSPKPYQPDLMRMEERITAPSVQRDLKTLGISHLLPILGFQMADHADQPSFIQWLGLIHSDFYPVLDYVAPRGFFIGTKAGGVKGLDERTRSPINTRLWIEDYLRDRELNEDAFRECFSFALLHPSLFEQAPAMWAGEWRKHFPRSVEAQTAVLNSATPNNRGPLEAAGRIKGRKGDYWAGIARKAEFRLAFEDYTASLNYMQGGDAENLLAAVTRLTEERDVARDPELYQWRGQLEYDLGMYPESSEHLAQAARLFAARAQLLKLTDTALLLCEVNLAAGKSVRARQVFDQFLSGSTGELRVWLMRSRIQDALKRKRLESES